jgi:UDP-galactopyranose mutase
MAPALPIIVFSHLRWDWVFQRPQHLLTRFAARTPIIFFEEPMHDANASDPYIETHSPHPNVVVARPRTPGPAHGFADSAMPLLRKMLSTLLRERRVGPAVAWFYTPCALPLLEAVDADVVVYDCMDELSAFRGAPPELVERERELFARADVVFTGGPSLFAAKRERHANVHCFPSSVDAAHFAQALSHAMDEHPEQAGLARPRLGYYGVIDERIDLELLAHMAAARPEWQIVMVGPVTKVDPAHLPKAANIHYFGQRAYADLPAFLSGWDVCLLPFALNEATRYISPTKTLEYMAAEKPIVGTPIRDVVDPYSHCVGIGRTAEEFVAHCDESLHRSGAARQLEIERMRAVLAETSWDRTVAAMAAQIDAVRSRRQGAAEGTTTAAANVRAAADAGESGQRPAKRPRRSHELVIIGAGPTGLSAAYHFDGDALLIEKNDTVGGWCRSIEDNGFTFDFAGHIMFSNDPYVHELYGKLLGDNVHWQDREAWIYSKNVYTRYPFQGSLYGLPPAVIQECIMGAIEARYGEAAAAPAPGSSAAATTEVKKQADIAATVASGNGAPAKANDKHSPARMGKRGAAGRHVAPGPVLRSFDPKDDVIPIRAEALKPIEDCCGDGVLESTARLGRACSKPESARAANANGNATNGNGNAANGTGHAAALPRAQAPAPPANFEEFIYKVWGRGIAKHFAIPYNRKLWAVPLTEMETSWLGGRVPLPDLGEMIDGALHPSPKPMGPNARFGYPLRGGFQALMDGFLPHVKDKLRLKSPVKAISAKRRTVTFATGEEVGFEQLISTMPLPVLVRMLGDETPEAIRKAAAALRYVSVRCVNIGVGREKLTEKHWIYYPEDTVFHRVFVQGNASPHCNPPGGFGLTCEITYAPTKPLPCDGDALIQRCIDDCRKVGLFGESDPVWTANQVDMPYAYVVYDHNRKENVAKIREWLLERDIHLAGRYSEWEYYNSDHAFLAGKKAVEAVLAHRAAQVPAVVATAAVRGAATPPAAQAV